VFFSDEILAAAACEYARIKKGWPVHVDRVRVNFIAALLFDQYATIEVHGFKFYNPFHLQDQFRSDYWAEAELIRMELHARDVARGLYRLFLTSEYEAWRKERALRRRVRKAQKAKRLLKHKKLRNHEDDDGSSSDASGDEVDAPVPPGDAVEPKWDPQLPVVRVQIMLMSRSRFVSEIMDDGNVNFFPYFDMDVREVHNEKFHGGKDVHNKHRHHHHRHHHHHDHHHHQHQHQPHHHNDQPAPREHHSYEESAAGPQGEARHRRANSRDAGDATPVRTTLTTAKVSAVKKGTSSVEGVSSTESQAKGSSDTMKTPILSGLLRVHEAMDERRKNLQRRMREHRARKVAKKKPGDYGFPFQLKCEQIVLHHAQFYATHLLVALLGNGEVRFEKEREDKPMNLRHLELSPMEKRDRLPSGQDGFYMQQLAHSIVFPALLDKMGVSLSTLRLVVDSVRPVVQQSLLPGIRHTITKLAHGIRRRSGVFTPRKPVADVDVSEDEEEQKTEKETSSTASEPAEIDPTTFTFGRWAAEHLDNSGREQAAEGCDLHAEICKCIFRDNDSSKGSNIIPIAKRESSGKEAIDSLEADEEESWGKEFFHDLTDGQTPKAPSGAESARTPRQHGEDGWNRASATSQDGSIRFRVATTL